MTADFKDGVSKAAERLSSFASNVMSSIQVRYSCLSSQTPLHYRSCRRNRHEQINPWTDDRCNCFLLGSTDDVSLSHVQLFLFFIPLFSLIPYVLFSLSLFEFVIKAYLFFLSAFRSNSNIKFRTITTTLNMYV
jgi:hypothetical protein